MEDRYELIIKKDGAQFFGIKDDTYMSRLLFTQYSMLCSPYNLRLHNENGVSVITTVGCHYSHVNGKLIKK